MRLVVGPGRPWKKTLSVWADFSSTSTPQFSRSCFQESADLTVPAHLMSCPSCCLRLESPSPVPSSPCGPVFTSCQPISYGARPPTPAPLSLAEGCSLSEQEKAPPSLGRVPLKPSAPPPSLYLELLLFFPFQKWTGKWASSRDMIRFLEGF